MNSLDAHPDRSRLDPGAPRALIALTQAYVIGGGALSFLAWALDVPRWADWLGSGIAIQPNTALASCVAGLALVLLAFGYRHAAKLGGVFVASSGALVLFEDVTGLDFGVDTLFLFGREWGHTAVLAAGRMGPPAAISWTLIGSGIVLAAREPGAFARRCVPVFGILPAAISALGLVGYFYGASGLYTLPKVTAIALQTASFVFVTSLGLLASVHEVSPMRLLRDRGAGGILVRRVLPAIVIGPLLIGFFRLLGERSGYYDTAFGNALRTLSEIAVILAFLAWTASALNRHSRARERAAAEARASRAELESELDDTRLLQSVSTELVAEGDSQRFYESVLGAAQRIMRADFASMQMLHADRGTAGELNLLAYRGFSAEAAELWRWVSAESGCSCGVALATQRRVVVPDVLDSAFTGAAHRTAYAALGIRAMQSTPLMSRSGTLLGMISTHWHAPHVPAERELRLLDILARQASDLIERRALEQQREELLAKERAARADAERAGRLKDEFLATLSHELRTPLNAIIGWTQLLRKDLSDPEKALYAIDVIERNGRLQAQLVTDLLDVSRIISGSMRLDVQVVDLTVVVGSVVDSLTPAARAKGVELYRVIEPLPAPLHGDPARLQQVFWNLLSNAVKFTPRGGHVRILLTHTATHAEIRVTDTGSGIAPEFLPHVFERFRQADATSSRAHGGLGLGLAIVKELVELHGGTVRATSEGRDRGATFAIALPFAHAHAITAARGREARANERTARDVAPVWNGLQVLVVDDEPDSLAIVRRVLEDAGARARTVSSAAAALDALATQRFDLLVSDIGMPGRDGYALIMDVRARGFRLPALALTAFAGEEDRRRVLAAGYEAHLAKPAEPAVLRLALERLLANRQPS